jgi:hypothetical protein
MAALAIIAVTILIAGVQHLLSYVAFAATTQPSPDQFQFWRVIWSSVAGLVEEVAVPAMSFWILRQPEFARATQATSAGGFQVVTQRMGRLPPEK